MIMVIYLDNFEVIWWVFPDLSWEKSENPYCFVAAGFWSNVKVMLSPRRPQNSFFSHTFPQGDKMINLQFCKYDVKLVYNTVTLALLTQTYNINLWICLSPWRFEQK